MINKPRFHIHTENDCQIFAVKLERIALATALSRFEENYYALFLQRQANWLTCLINVGDERMVYDLRIVCQPNAENFTEGVLQIALLCKMCGSDRAKAADYAVELLRYVRLISKSKTNSS